MLAAHSVHGLGVLRQKFRDLLVHLLEASGGFLSPCARRGARLDPFQRSLAAIGIELHKSLNDRMFQSSDLHGRRALKKRFDGLSNLHPAQGLRRSASDLGIGMPQTIHDCFRCPCVMMHTNGV